MATEQHVESQDQPTRTGQDEIARGGRLPRGYGAMRDLPLDLDPRIDLTKPIYEQVLALEKADKEAAGRR